MLTGWHQQSFFQLVLIPEWGA